MRKGVKKDFNYVWDVIELSILIIVGYSVLDMLLSISTYIGKVIPASIFGILILIFGFGTIGYISAKKKDSESAGKYGAYAGLIVGLASAIIGIITFYYFPEKIAAALEQAAQKGADISAAQSFMKIGLYINFIISPAINAGIGALVAWISGLIFRKK